jgi:hypothetical protein
MVVAFTLSLLVDQTEYGLDQVRFDILVRANSSLQNGNAHVGHGFLFTLPDHVHPLHVDKHATQLLHLISQILPDTKRRPDKLWCLL